MNISLDTSRLLLGLYPFTCSNSFRVSSSSAGFSEPSRTFIASFPPGRSTLWATSSTRRHNLADRRSSSCPLVFGAMSESTTSNSRPLPLVVGAAGSLVGLPSRPLEADAPPLDWCKSLFRRSTSRASASNSSGSALNASPWMNPTFAPNPRKPPLGLGSTSITSIPTTAPSPRTPTISDATCIQLPGAHPRSSTQSAGLSSLNRSLMSSSLYAERARYPSALAFLKYSSCRIRRWAIGRGYDALSD
jgi:hypothetical protein